MHSWHVVTSRSGVLLWHELRARVPHSVAAHAALEVAQGTKAMPACFVEFTFATRNTRNALFSVFYQSTAPPPVHLLRLYALLQAWKGYEARQKLAANTLIHTEGPASAELRGALFSLHGMHPSTRASARIEKPLLQAVPLTNRNTNANEAGWSTSVFQSTAVACVPLLIVISSLKAGVGWQHSVVKMSED